MSTPCSLHTAAEEKIYAIVGPRIAATILGPDPLGALCLLHGEALGNGVVRVEGGALRFQRRADHAVPADTWRVTQQAVNRSAVAPGDRDPARVRGDWKAGDETTARPTSNP